MGSSLRQRAHVQPAPRRFGRREEKVGFSIVLGRGVSCHVMILAFPKCAQRTLGELEETWKGLGGSDLTTPGNPPCWKF